MGTAGLLVGAAGCSDPVVDPVWPTATDSLTCVTARVEAGELELVLSEATLTVPEFSLLPNTEVELCHAPAEAPEVVGRRWRVGPFDLRPAYPLALRIRHANGSDDLRMFVPGVEGARPELEPGFANESIIGQVYRPGFAWVAHDPRQAHSYGDGIAADVLFVLDTDSDMVFPRSELVRAFPHLHNRLRASGANWRLAVTTSDLDAVGNGTQGALRASGEVRYLGADSVGAASTFEQMLNTADNGSENRAFGAAKGAYGGWHNEDVFRLEASAAFVFVSERAAVSRGADPLARDFLRWMRPRHTAYGIIEQGFDGERYVTVIEGSGGVQTDFWVWDYDAVLDAVVAQVEDAATFRFPARVQPETLEAWALREGDEPVRIADAGVTYDDADLTLVLDTFHPSEAIVVLAEPAW